MAVKGGKRRFLPALNGPGFHAATLMRTELLEWTESALDVAR
jgi:hypothetical protein